MEDTRHLSHSSPPLVTHKKNGGQAVSAGHRLPSVLPVRSAAGAEVSGERCGEAKKRDAHPTWI